MNVAQIPRILASLAVVLASFPAAADPSLTRETKLTASDPARFKSLGSAVALSGATSVVGAPLDAHAGPSSGSAYVFVRGGGEWSQQQKLTATDAAAGNQFGHAVAVSEHTALVGAHGNSGVGFFSGAVYVFERSGRSWSQQQKLTPDDAAEFRAFGISVALSGDTAVIGSIGDDHAGPLSGAAYVFVRSAGVWSQQQKLTASDASEGDHFGWSVAVSGDTALIGAPFRAGSGAGSAYVFVRSGGAWSQQQKLTPGDAAAGTEFGHAVALNGETAVIGSPSFGLAGSNTGAAYVFFRSASVWTEQQKLAASEPAEDDQFGTSVAFTGEAAVVGSPLEYSGSGAAYVFSRSAGVWSQRQRLAASDITAAQGFGWSVATAGNTALAGAPGDSRAGTGSGAAYAYDLSLPGYPRLGAWVGLKNSDDVGIRFDLQAKVHLNGFLIGSGELDAVNGGSSGFSNAKLSVIPLTLSGPLTVSSGDTLEIEVLARNACSGSGKSSGTARLWYNGSAVDNGAARDAGSRLDTAIGGTNSDYFLRGNLALSTTPGSSRLSVDKAVGAKCGSFVSFGIWSVTD